MQVGDVVVILPVPCHGNGGAVGVVGEVVVLAVYLHVGELAALVGVEVGGLAVGALGSQAVQVVDVAPTGGASLAADDPAVDYVAAAVHDLAAPEQAHVILVHSVDGQGAVNRRGLAGIVPANAAVWAVLPAAV